MRHEAEWITAIDARVGVRSKDMRDTKKVSVELGMQGASLRRHLRSGQYLDANEVIRDALRALDREEAALEEMLRMKVRASLANKKPNVSGDEAFRRIELRHARRMKAR